VLKGRDLFAFPLNPLARRGSFYAGWDLVRAFCVLMLSRKVDLMVAVGESNIAVILLLRRILRFKPRVVLREVSGWEWPKRDRVADFVRPAVDGVSALTPHQKTGVDTRQALIRAAREAIETRFSDTA